MAMSMFERPADILERKTQQYWRVCNIRTGKSKEKISVEGAIKLVVDLKTALGEHRPLRGRVLQLSDDIIQGAKKPKTAAAVILILKQAVVATNV